MTSNIPEQIDPFRFAEQNLTLSGEINIADFKRLSEIVFENKGDVKAKLSFSIDKQGIIKIVGHLEAQVILQCQRCLDPFKYEIMSDFVLGVVDSEEAKLPKEYEPVVISQQKLDVKELIEDEIILNLPIIHRHKPELCKVKLPSDEEGGQKEENRNPFQILQSLKDKGK